MHRIALRIQLLQPVISFKVPMAVSHGISNNSFRSIRFIRSIFWIHYMAGSAELSIMVFNKMAAHYWLQPMVVQHGVPTPAFQIITRIAYHRIFKILMELCFRLSKQEYVSVPAVSS